MPLRIVTRKDTGTLWIMGTIHPAGSKEGYRIRQRAGSDSEADAREEAAAIEREILRNHHLGQRPVQRGFSQAVSSYLSHTTRSVGTVALIDRLHRHFGNIPLRKIGQEAVDEAREVLFKRDASPGTVKRNLYVPLRAILMHASRRGWCDHPHFDLPKEPKGRTAFLLPDQAESLIQEGRHIAPLIRFLLCTGCRLGETLEMEWPQVDLGGARVRLWADQTKGRQERVVKLNPAATAALASLPGREGAVFRTHKGEPYRSTSESGYGGQIKTAWERACKDGGLKNYTPHDLRHTWASWHHAVHRDLLLLKQDGGWSSVTLVERYAHLIPEGHVDGIRRVWGISVAITKVA